LDYWIIGLLGYCIILWRSWYLLIFNQEGGWDEKIGLLHSLP